jgi:hypothetical protein
MTCYKVVLTSLIQSWYNKILTSLTTQGCNNIVISWLYLTCWNNLATTLLQLLTSSILVHNLGQAVRTQLVDGLLADFLQDVRFLHVYRRLDTRWTVQHIVFRDMVSKLSKLQSGFNELGFYVQPCLTPCTSFVLGLLIFK